MGKKHLFINLIAGLTLVGLMIALTGCGGGLPKEIKNRAKAIPGAIESHKSKVDKQKEKYNSLSQSSDFKSIKEFATKENWINKFQLAHAELDRAKTIYGKDLAPLVSKNRLESSPQVQQQILRIKKIIRNAEELSRYPFSRFSKIKDTIKNMSALNSKAIKNAGNIKQISSNLKNGAIAKAESDFPDLNQKINKKFSPLLNLERQSQDHLSVVAAEFNKHSSGSATTDYASFTDSSEALSVGYKEAIILKTNLNKDIKQLYTSYTKILKDMKEEYFVSIKRESWNENSDFYDPRFASFRRQVSPEAYEVLTSDKLDTIAAITAGFTGSKLKNNIGNLWKELKINPTEQWPGRSHNAASFFVEDAREAYFHKYLLEKNGETKETNWEQVDASFYDANIEFLGMAILSKPYGVFEKDRITQATPPGMAYVGNEKYGEWKKDNSGNSFWSWYGKYALFSMLFSPRPSYYGYNSWNGWNTGYRNRRPYFGKTQNGFQKYGTNGTSVKKSPRFQSTNFAKSGGFKSQRASVRGAGANLRGGGPKSKGK
ncbi:MAG: hypothetical protein GY699_22645 [Desulfobacteraceae bacterium]|nr:hypothetical protein [Desulfobacteraceae bacterium]